MASPRKPTGVTAERFVQYLYRDPTTEFGWRWRRQPLSEFDGDERQWAAWNSRFADKPAGCISNNKPSVTLNGRTVPFSHLKDEIGEEAINSTYEKYENGLLVFGSDEPQGWGALAEVIRDASREGGRTLDDLTVLGIKRDPYRFGTPLGHREGKWFASLFAALVSTTALIHLRGFHYLLVASGGVVKPDGKPYENTDKDYRWMTDRAAKAARWLGLVGFERFVDRRNAAPVIFRPEPPKGEPFGMAHGSMGAWLREVGGKLEIVQPTITPNLVNFGKRQKYFFVFFGEKSSLDPVLRPLAQQYQANMYLCAGEISDTLIYQMAADAVADGRPMVVFTFSDFDPSGRQMPVSIARKLQALRDLEFPDLEAQVVPVALTLEQVLAERLPTTPVKPGDKRRERWERAFGQPLRNAGLVPDNRPAQVEIDALAALRPDVLTQITHDAIASKWDADLAEKTAEAEQDWKREAEAAIEAQADAVRLTAIREEAGIAAAYVNAALSDLTKAQDRMTRASDDLKALVDGIDLPEAPEAPEPETDEGNVSPLADIGDNDNSYADVTDRLKAHKGYGKGETVENGDDDEEEGEDDED
jgi:hypothetical protein